MCQNRSNNNSNRNQHWKKKGRHGGNHVHKQANWRSDLKNQAFRISTKSRCTLSSEGMEALDAALNDEVLVFPHHGYAELPVLSVTPKELYSHVLARLSAFVAGDFVEVYGSVASNVIAVDQGFDNGGVQPTDIDARFFVFPDDWVWERCRMIVEEFVAFKLQAATGSPSLHLVRSYFHKMVVVDGAFSLLSIGNPSTGKMLDLEFCGIPAHRKYFDEANSFVIPMNLMQLNDMSKPDAPPVAALCMAGTSFQGALNLSQGLCLVVHKPKEVVNGLSLYAHAICDKGLTPGSEDAEGNLGRELVRAFVAQCGELRSRCEDPLRFVGSFLRSHYPSRHVSAFATAVQLVAEVAAFSPSLDTGRDCVEWAGLGMLLGQAAWVAVEEAGGDAEVVAGVIAIAGFVANPVAVYGEVAAQRQVEVFVGGNRVARLLAKTARKIADSISTEYCCAVAADMMRQRCGGLTSSTPSWLRCAVKAVCAALESNKLEGNVEGEPCKPDAEAKPRFVSELGSNCQRIYSLVGKGLAEMDKNLQDMGEKKRASALQEAVAARLVDRCLVRSETLEQAAMRTEEDSLSSCSQSLADTLDSSTVDDIAATVHGVVLDMCSTAAIARPGTESTSEIVGAVVECVVADMCEEAAARSSRVVAASCENGRAPSLDKVCVKPCAVVAGIVSEFVTEMCAVAACMVPLHSFVPDAPSRQSSYDQLLGDEDNDKISCTSEAVSYSSMDSERSGRRTRASSDVSDDSDHEQNHEEIASAVMDAVRKQGSFQHGVALVSDTARVQSGRDDRHVAMRRNSARLTSFAIENLHRCCCRPTRTWNPSALMLPDLFQAG